MKYTRAGRAARAKIFFLLIKYANLWRPVCRRHAIVWKILVPCDYHVYQVSQDLSSVID